MPEGDVVSSQNAERLRLDTNVIFAFSFALMQKTPEIIGMQAQKNQGQPERVRRLSRLRHLS